MNHLVADIYRTFERGQSPDADVVPDDDGGVKRVLAPSQRNDVVLAERVEGADNKFNVIRIEPVNESRSEQMRRGIRNPGRPTTDTQFKHCKYQLKHTVISELGDFDNLTVGGCVRLIHTTCHWNRNTTRLRTAQSPNALQHAWDQWKQKHSG